MERLWSGGEASPPIPLESFRMRAEILKPKHALLFPGSGSQYVGMGHFLKEYKGAGRVWDEAQSVLAEWEDWVETIGLEEMGGEVGELGRMMREREPDRLKAKGLKDVVFDGPQVSPIFHVLILEMELTSLDYRTSLQSHGTPNLRFSSLRLRSSARSSRTLTLP